MRTSMIKFAALAFALSVTAMPANNLQNRDNDSEVATTDSSDVIEDANYLAAATTKTKKSSKKTKTTKASKATGTKKSSKTKTKAAAAAAKTTAAADSDAGSGDSDSGDSAATSDAAETGSGEAAETKKSGSTKTADSEEATETKKSGSTKTADSGASETTKATTTGGGSSGGSGGSSGGKLPASSGTSVLAAAQTIEAGGSFDGGMVMFDRGASCTGQAEGGDKDAVFQILEGGSLSNVIIGPNQIEGVHCQGACKLTNVWWSAVCEDAFTIKNQAAGATTTISGGGAFGATDKVLQHNGAGTLSVSDFTVGTFGKLYRACGNCATSAERHVVMDGITATDGDILAGINSNFGDTAKITNSKLSSVKSVCTTFKGVAKGSEPSKLTENEANASCVFGSDVVQG